MMPLAELRGGTAKKNDIYVVISTDKALYLGRKRDRKKEMKDNVSWMTLADKKISRQHARIKFNSTLQKFQLKVIGKNGVTVNNKHISPDKPDSIVTLPRHATVEMGGYTFTYTDNRAGDVSNSASETESSSPEDTSSDSGDSSDENSNEKRYSQISDDSDCSLIIAESASEDSDAGSNDGPHQKRKVLMSKPKKKKNSRRRNPPRSKVSQKYRTHKDQGKKSLFDDLPTPAGWPSNGRSAATTAFAKRIAGENGEASKASGNSKKKQSKNSDAKRKRHSRSVKMYTPAPRDADGNVIFPIHIGGLTILDLGHIAHKRKKFHAKRYIWPIGFKSTRLYPSFRNPEVRIKYASEIVDGGNEPVFVVEPLFEDGEPCKENERIIATTPSGAWTEVVKRVNSLKLEKTGKRLFTTVSGPEMFGFSHATIAKLIQDLPGADLCERYVARDFVEKVNSRKRKRGGKGKNGAGDDQSTKKRKVATPDDSNSNNTKKPKTETPGEIVEEIEEEKGSILAPMPPSEEFEELETGFSVPRSGRIVFNNPY
eukprot:TRINITY_DN4558_c0_g1_i1.p1 TRINITY_DN4558_c0_g1~~TRINITY_DN4558_c0_g1_i1.p1  ORF type:complete len:541 (+),score=110.11 TRINITY_DN4558_c0_g1_i1:94-1716(+)